MATYYRELPPHVFAKIPFPLRSGKEGSEKFITRDDFEKLSEGERADLWYIDEPLPGETRRVFPFFDDTGAFAWTPPKDRKVLPPVVTSMTRAELGLLGYSDEELTREHAKIAAHEIGDRDLRNEDPDTTARQLKRRRWFDELMDVLYQTR